MQSDAENTVTRSDSLRAVRVLLRLYKKYTHTVLTFLVNGVISAIGDAATPFLLGAFVDALASPGAQVAALGFVVPRYAAILALWAGIQIVLVAIDRHLSRESDLLGVRVWADYLIAGVAHVIRLPLSYHKENKMGEVFQKINRTGESIDSLTSSVLIQMSPQLLSIGIALGVTFYISAVLGTFLCATVGVYLLLFAQGVRPLAKMQRSIHEVVPRVWGDAQDFLSNVRHIKEAGAEERVHKRLLSGFSHDVVELWAALLRAWGDLYFLQKSVIFIAQLVIFLYSIHAVLGGSMTIGDVLAVYGYAGMVFGPFVVIGRSWQHIQNGFVGIRETERILEEPEERYRPTSNAYDGPLEGHVVFEDVSFSYDSATPILEHVSFSVEPGETVGLVGESGVGKTTLVDLLLGFYFASRGHVYLDGHDVRDMDLHALRTKIGVVSQDIVLFNDTIAHNIVFDNPGVPVEEMKRAARLAAADEFIEKFPDGWEQLVGERGIKLSGGQRQRVAIARAILKNPSILILDEPTSALDARSEHRLQESFEEVMRGKTTFIIAHRFSMVRHAHKIIVLKGGKVEEMGTHDELLARGGEYAHLYELQTGLHDPAPHMTADS